MISHSIREIPYLSSCIIALSGLDLRRVLRLFMQHYGEYSVDFTSMHSSADQAGIRNVYPKHPKAHTFWSTVATHLTAACVRVALQSQAVRQGTCNATQGQVVIEMDQIPFLQWQGGALTVVGAGLIWIDIDWYRLISIDDWCIMMQQIHPTSSWTMV